MREAIDQLIASGNKKLLPNLAEVPMIDSSGIGAIIKSFTTGLYLFQSLKNPHLSLFLTARVSVQPVHTSVRSSV